MPKLRRYTCEKELVLALREYPWLAWFKLERYSERKSTLETIIYHSIGGNTFRAFRNSPSAPSKVFRTWALKILKNSRLENFKHISSQNDYSIWLDQISDDFRRYWRRRMQKDIPFGPSLKLPNLLAKRLCLFNGISEPRFLRIVHFLEVPLDKYTIQAIANCKGSKIGNIPSSATMSFIKNRQIYNEFQMRIRSITRKARVPAIALDCLAWDASHDKVASKSNSHVKRNYL